MDIVIRAIETVGEYHACERLQRQVWDMPDDLDVVPLHLLRSMQHNGGLLLGAIHADTLAGFVLGYPGSTADGMPKHCSHMMGILPEYRSQGLGYRLKLAQRDHALAQRYELVTWTYDPLESRNANLNVRKLGVLCDTYIRDYYGPMTDGLNVGLPSDRFEVDWWIASGRGAGRRDGDADAPGRYVAAGVANDTRVTAGLRAPSSMVLDLRKPEILVEIPADYQSIKVGSPDLAIEWRLATRQIFESYFAAGYQVVDFMSEGGGGERRSFYVLKLG